MSALEQSQRAPDVKATNTGSDTGASSVVEEFSNADMQLSVAGDASAELEVGSDSNAELASAITTAAPQSVSADAAAGGGESVASGAAASTAWKSMAETTRGGFAARALEAAGSKASPADLLGGDYDKPITRAEAAEIAVKAMSAGLVLEGQPGVFTDVEVEHRSAAYVYRAKEMGLFSGFDDGSFRPDQDLGGGSSLILNRISDPEWRAEFDRKQSIKDANARREMPKTDALTVGDTDSHKRTFTDEIYDKHKKSAAAADVDLSYASHKWEADQFKKSWEKNRERYEAVAKQTGVPARLIAALHWRESSGNFGTYLHQGDPLGKPPVHWPTNIPTFSKWEESAVHALNQKKSIKNDLGMTDQTTDLAAMATYAEYYNGLGYNKKGKPSPYVYSGTDQYSKGKYVADGVYDPNTKDRQVGVVALMKHISEGEGASTVLEGQIARGADVVSETEITVTDAKGKTYTAKTSKGGMFSLEGTLAPGAARVTVGGRTGTVNVANGTPSWLSLDLETAAKVEDKAKTDDKKDASDKDPAAVVNPGIKSTLKQGSKSDEVKMLQSRLKSLGYDIAADGDFGKLTDAAVRKFQKENGLEVDGVVGPKTLEKLFSSAKSDKSGDTKKAEPSNKWLGGATLKQGDKSDTVKELQKRLNSYGANLKVDGDFGPATLEAVKKFQASRGLASDGQVGPLTGLALDGGSTRTTGSNSSGSQSSGNNSGSNSSGANTTGGPTDAKYDTVTEERGALAAKSARIAYTEGQQLYGSGSWETTGANRGKMVDQFKSANKGGGNNDMPWCGMFVGYNYEKAGIRDEITNNLAFWSGYRMHQFFTEGKYVGGKGKAGDFWQPHHTQSLTGLTGSRRKAALDAYGPQAGDVVLFRSDYSHVAMVTGYDPKTGELQIMEGNRSDRVQATTYNVNDSQITFIGRFNDADFAGSSEVDASLKSAKDPKVKHDDQFFGKTT